MPATGLDVIADESGRLAVLAMDQRATLRRMLTAAGQPAEPGDLEQFKIDVIGALSPLASAVLTDVEYGVGPVRRAGALADGVGLLIAAEPAEKQKAGGEYLNAVDPERNAAWVKAHAGDALKFLIYWNPDRAAVPGQPDLAQITLDVVSQVVADCAAEGVPSIIEPLVSFAPDAAPSQADKEAAVIRSAIRLAPLGMSLLKLEWPGGPEGCAEITKNLGRVPWALLSAGVAYDAFVERVEVALDNGACGMIAGRAIWGEAVNYVGDERRAWLADVAVPRMRRLVELLQGRGRSWREAAS
jgi:tagatose 1,6-diphosphate aldolase/sulfofructosephosphate aldolase